jgi:hypothetical protein
METDCEKIDSTAPVNLDSTQYREVTLFHAQVNQPPATFFTIFHSQDALLSQMK